MLEAGVPSGLWMPHFPSSKYYKAEANFSYSSGSPSQTINTSFQSPQSTLLKTSLAAAFDIALSPNTTISFNYTHEVSSEQCLLRFSTQNLSTAVVTYGIAAIAKTTPVTATLHPNVTLVVIRNATTASARGIAQGGDQVLQYWDGI